MPDELLAAEVVNELQNLVSYLEDRQDQLNEKEYEADLVHDTKAAGKWAARFLENERTKKQVEETLARVRSSFGF